jgi:hypothetical protein
VAKFEDKMDGREECRILTECSRKKKNTDKKERERNEYAREEVETLKEQKADG